MQPVVATGITLPADFPTTSYDTLNKLVGEKYNKHSLFFDFAGAWNAVSYRYLAMTEAGEHFTRCLTRDGASPPPKSRYKQETGLFVFFSAGFATLESAFYALYSVGGMTANSPFRLDTEEERRSISPKFVAAAYQRHFPSDPLVPILRQVLEDPGFEKFRTVRNTLTHRTAPGRNVFMSDRPTEWRLTNAPFDASITADGRADVSRLLSRILVAAAEFGSRVL